MLLYFLKLFFKTNDKLQLDTLSENEFFVNWIKVFEKKIDKTLKTLRKPVDKNEWSVPPVVINAFYNSNENEISIV